MVVGWDSLEYLVNLILNTFSIVFFLIIARLLKNGSECKVKNVLCILAICIAIISFIRIEFDNISNIIYETKKLRNNMINASCIVDDVWTDLTEEGVKINKAECVFCWISFAIATINLILFIFNFIKGITCTENSIESNDKENNLQEYKEE